MFVVSRNQIDFVSPYAKLKHAMLSSKGFFSLSFIGLLYFTTTIIFSVAPLTTSTHYCTERNFENVPFSTDSMPPFSSIELPLAIHVLGL